MTKIVTDNRARQGPKGRPVLFVLIGSLFLLGVYMVSLLMWSGSQSPNSPSTDAARTTATGTASGSKTNPSDRTPSANPAYPAPAATGTAGQPASR